MFGGVIDVEAYVAGQKRRVHDSAWKVLDSLRTGRLMDGLQVEYNGDTIPLQEFLARVRPANAELDGINFDVFRSLPKSLRNLPWSRNKIEVTEEQAEDLARTFEDYTFAHNPVTRSTFFGSIRDAQRLQEEVAATRMGSKYLVGNLRRSLGRVLRSDDIATYAVVSIDDVKGNAQTLGNIELEIGDIGIYDPFNLFSREGWKDMIGKSRATDKLMGQARDEATQTLTSLQRVGNEYRTNYVSKRDGIFAQII